MHADLDRAHHALVTSARNLTLDQLTWRPEGKWSAAEIVEHLSRTYSGTTKGLERLLAAGTPSATRANARQRLGVFLIVTCGYFPSGRKAPRVALPTGQVDPADVLDLALAHLRRMDEALAATAARFGEGHKIMDHPILGPLSPREWQRFHWMHTRHHARQLEARRHR